MIEVVRAGWRSLLVMFAALAMFAAACGSADDDAVVTDDVAVESEDSAAEADEAGGADQSDIAESAGGVVVPTADGGQLDFGSLEGQDTVLWFWAPW